MPYIDGLRVSQEEFIKANSTSTRMLHTGPNGDNPAEPPEIDPVTSGPKQPKQAGSKRSKTSAKSAKAAIADALGVTPESLPEVPSITDSDVEPSNDPE